MVAFGLAARHRVAARMRDLTLADRWSRVLTMAFVGTAMQRGDHEGHVFEGSLADAVAVQYSLRLSGISVELSEIPLTAVPLLFDSTWCAMARIKVDSEHRKRANVLISDYRSLTLRRSRGASNPG